MKDLTAIIKNLNKGETELIRNYYKSDGRKEFKNRLKLFEAIKSNKVATDVAASKYIYNKQPNSAYSHLKSRLKEDILNLMLTEDGKYHFSMPAEQARYNCSKLHLNARVLLTRGVYKTAVKLLKKGIRLAEKYELTDKQVLLEDTLRTHLGFKKGLKKYKPYEESVHKNVEILRHILDSKTCYNNIMLAAKFSSSKNAVHKPYATQAARKLGGIYERSGSSNVGYWYYNISVFNYYLSKQYVKSLNQAYRLLKLLNAKPAIQSNARLASCHLQIAEILLCLEQPEKAIKHAKEGIQLFKDDMLNELQGMELLFHAYFYSRQFKKSDRLINKAVQHPKFNATKLTQGKWYFYKANLLFAKGQYDESRAVLNQRSALSKDKRGWYLGYRLLEILNYIELGEYGGLSYKIDNFKKLVYKYPPQERKETRIYVIYRILLSIAKNTHNIQAAYQKETKNLKLLAKKKGPFAWQPLKHELIRFDKWFERKCNPRSDIAV